METIRIGIQLAAFGMPLTKALEAAARLGAAGVELDARNDVRPQEMGETASRHFLKRLDDYGLKASAVSFPTRRGYEVAEDLDRRVEATKEAMRMAYRLGARVLLNHVGQIADEGPARDQLLESLDDLGKFSQHVGVFFCATTGAEAPERLAGVINDLPEGHLAVNLDPGALLMNGYSPAEAVQLLGPDIRHVAATDGVRDLAKQRGVETQLGRGAADFHELAAQLEEHYYRGYFTIQRRGATSLDELAQSVSYLKRLRD